MGTIGEQLFHYAKGNKAEARHYHSKIKGKFRSKENKNVTKVQDFLSENWDSLQRSLKREIDKNETII